MNKVEVSSNQPKIHRLPIPQQGELFQSTDTKSFYVATWASQADGDGHIFVNLATGGRFPDGAWSKIPKTLVRVPGGTEIKLIAGVQ